MARKICSFLSGGNILKTWRRRCCITVQAAAVLHLAGLWENASTPYLAHLFMSRPLGLSAGRGEKWLEIYDTNHRGKDFTTLYIYRIHQTCWGWSKSFAWISGHSCKELFLGTFTDLWSCIQCYRDYTMSKITPPYLLSPFGRNPNVSVPYPAWKGLSSSQISSQVSTLGRGLPQSPPCCTLHGNL